MVDAGHAIGTGWTFVKNEWLCTFSLADAFTKSIFLCPCFEHFSLESREIQLFKFFVGALHNEGCKGRETPPY